MLLCVDLVSRLVQNFMEPGINICQHQDPSEVLQEMTLKNSHYSSAAWLRWKTELLFLVGEDCFNIQPLSSEKGEGKLEESDMVK